MKTIRPATRLDQPVYGPVKGGDTVIVQTPDGRRSRFVVQAIDGDVITAPDGKRYGRPEIVRLQRKSFSGPRTVGLIAGISAAGFLVLAAALFLSDDSLLNGGYSPQIALDQRTIASLLACLAAANVGCTSMKTINPATTPDQPVYLAVEAGETVRPNPKRRPLALRSSGD